MPGRTDAVRDPVLQRLMFGQRHQLLLPRGHHPMCPRLLHGRDRVRRPNPWHLWVPEAYDAVRQRRLSHLLPRRHGVSFGLPGAFGDNGEDLLRHCHVVHDTERLL